MSQELSVAEASALIGLVYDASLEKNQWSSLVGQLASTHEAAIEGLEVELMIPVDEATEACLLAAYGR